MVHTVTVCQYADANMHILQVLHNFLKSGYCRGKPARTGPLFPAACGTLTGIYPYNDWFHRRNDGVRWPQATGSKSSNTTLPTAASSAATNAITSLLSSALATLNSALPSLLRTSPGS